MKLSFSKLFFSSCLILAAAGTELFPAQPVPFSVRDNMFNQADSGTLGLPYPEGIETSTVWSAEHDGDHFCNGAVITFFNGKYYCQWQSSKDDEDAPDTHVMYSTSSDAVSWSTPRILCPALSPSSSSAGAYRSSGGWIVCSSTADADNTAVAGTAAVSNGTARKGTQAPAAMLTALINEWPADITPRGGRTLYMTTRDGIHWTEPKPVTMKDGSPLNAVFEQDPHIISGGRIIGAAHFQPGLFVSPIYTDDPTGTGGWVRAKFTAHDSGSSTSVEMEPSLFVNSSGNIVMIFRDQNSSFVKLASVSTDRGESWTPAVKTAMPDARTKQSAGNFDDGTSFMVGNPVNSKMRIPLAVTLSKDGMRFDSSYLLRSAQSENSGNSQNPHVERLEVKFPGKAKKPGFHYPKSFVHNGYLFVVYTESKEAVKCTRIPVVSLEK